MKHTFNQEHIIGLFCVALGGLVLFLTRNFPAGQGNVQISGPAFFPNVLSIVLIIVGVIEGLTGSLKDEGEFASIGAIWRGMKKPEFINILMLVALFLFYIFFVELLGFIITTFIFLFIVMWRLGVPLIKNILYSVIFLVVIVLIFGKLFTVSLPSGILF